MLRLISRRLLPDSTSRQVAAIVIASVVLAHLLIIGSFVYFAPTDRLADRETAREIGLFIRVYQALPETERAAAVQAAASRDLQVHEVFGAPPKLAPLPPEFERPELQGTAQALGNPELVVIAGLRPTTADAEAMRRIVVGVAPQRWLVFDFRPRERFRPPPISERLILSTLILIGVPLLLISLWAAQKVTNPLRRLAVFTERFGESATPPPMPIDGTLEIRKLARAFNAILERLHRMVADRTNMLAAISHDLRTPLTRLRLRAEALDDGALRGKMLRDIQAMDCMLASTLGFIEQQHSREPAERLDLAALMQTLCDDFADGGYDVTYQGPLHHVAACRPVAMERALNNLIENALKFGSSAKLALQPTDDAVVVEVCDDGPGIAPQERENVLKPFYRTDAARGADAGGIGLGLAIVNTIVQADGGSLELLDAAADGGAPSGLCVRLRLPRSLPA
jgi:signal transduction histidine kinase